MSVTGTGGHFTCHACGCTWTGSEASVTRHWQTCPKTLWPPDQCVCCGRPWTSQTPGGSDPTDHTEQETP